MSATATISPPMRTGLSIARCTPPHLIYLLSAIWSPDLHPNPILSSCSPSSKKPGQPSPKPQRTKGEAGLKPFSPARPKLVMTTMNTPFESALRTAILAYIRVARRDDTTAMSVDNLLQCVRPPSASLAGAPLGTNAQYYYAQLFRRLCAEPLIASFTTM